MLLHQRYVMIKKHHNKKNPAAQAARQTFPDATPPVGKIHPLSKTAVAFEQIQQFRCPSRFSISEKMSI